MPCPHGRQKSRCRECGGSSICIHGKRKSYCRECGGRQICIHGKRKSTCRDCGGSQICIHDKYKADCRECGGSQICIHDKYKSYCRECGGSRICIHGKRKSTCKICSPQLVIINMIRGQVYRVFKQSSLIKDTHSIDYLGCDTDTLKNHFESKMTADMTFDNIHIDHIKPVSRFDLDDEEELLKCSHYTNLQPLLAKDNLELTNKWSEENEVFWNENIIYNPNYKEIYKLSPLSSP